MFYRFIANNLARIVIGAIILIGVVWLVTTLTGGKRAEVQAKLNANIAGAAMQSGQDAVATVGQVQGSEAAVDSITKENEHAIRSAPGADAPVNPAARDAALRGLCKHRAYIGNPKCVQFAPAP